MKRDFSPILKIKSENIKTIEQKIEEIKNKIDKTEREKNLLLKELFSQKLPKTSDKAGVLTLFKNTLSNLKTLIEEKEDKLKFFQKEFEKIQIEYKKALIDYEKIKYLQNISIKEYKEELARREQRELDEIASILYARVKR